MSLSYITLDEKLKSVSSMFDRFCRRQAELKNSKSQKMQQMTDSNNAVSEELAQALRPWKQKENRVIAAMKMASHNSVERLVSTQEVPYAPDQLSKYSMLINTTQKRDANAERLYTIASGMLKYVRNQMNNVVQEYDATKQTASSQLVKDIELATADEARLSSIIVNYLQSGDFTSLKNDLFENYSLFGGPCYQRDKSRIDRNGNVGLGTVRHKLSVPEGYLDTVSQYSQGLFDKQSTTIGMPFSIPIGSGCIIAEYNNNTEATVRKGILNFLLNRIVYSDKLPNQIICFDPLRFNSGTLESLLPLSVGDCSVIDDVPINNKEMDALINAIQSDITVAEKKQPDAPQNLLPSRVLFFNAYDNLYSQKAREAIYNFAINAARYNLLVIISLEKQRDRSESDKIKLLKNQSVCIGINDDGFYVSSATGNLPFFWYSIPENLSEDILSLKRPKVVKREATNSYAQNVGFEVPRYNKGSRAVVNIPYGIDNAGNVITLDFENSNFATFICGAAGSGKSTLIHALITGIISSMHPDDVEIWLIDFKMTEFSQYIDNIPPHVRYILLDESTNMVYDIIDRLTEILKARQNKFMKNWQSIKDVPPTEYMPALFVIIDEFSVMSNIIADSFMATDNYAEKLQTILAKGRGLGMHFIFASQGFSTSSGSKGLTDFSKAQIQQRIAMKADYEEIRSTLDLKDISDRDRQLISSIQPHYILVRMPEDENKNHLLHSHTLYIEDYADQRRLIAQINDMVKPSKVFAPYDNSSYIYKQPLVVDGNCYHKIDRLIPDFEKYINNHDDEIDDEVTVFLGEPRRMKPIYPHNILRAFGENILLLGSLNEAKPLVSILKSIETSLNLQSISLDCWSSKNNPLQRSLKKAGSVSGEMVVGTESVCARIKAVKKKIENKIYDDKFIVITGLENMTNDMLFLSGMSGISTSPFSGGLAKPTGPSFLDILNKSIETGVPLDLDEKSSSGEPNEVEEIYDARSDLEYIVTYGPLYGYHTVIIFHSIMEYEKAHLKNELFKHKVFFPFPKSQTMTLVGSYEASEIARMRDHVFLYTNGLESLTYRPYLYKSLSWDGWELDDSGNVVHVEDEFNYLM